MGDLVCGVEGQMPAWSNGWGIGVGRVGGEGDQHVDISLKKLCQGEREWVVMGVGRSQEAGVAFQEVRQEQPPEAGRGGQVEGTQQRWAWPWVGSSLSRAGAESGPWCGK